MNSTFRSRPNSISFCLVHEQNLLLNMNIAVTYSFMLDIMLAEWNPLHSNLNLPNDAISSPSTKEPQWSISCRSEFVLNWSTCVSCLWVHHKKALLHWPEDKNLKIWKVDSVFDCQELTNFSSSAFIPKLCPNFVHLISITYE